MSKAYFYLKKKENCLIHLKQKIKVSIFFEAANRLWRVKNYFMKKKSSEKIKLKSKIFSLLKLQ